MADRCVGITIRIRVGTGVAQGVTSLSAFDAALQQVGAADFNLVRISSVIPPASVIELGPSASSRTRPGDRMHVVYAERRATVAGEEVWAGIGWVQQEDGWGLFAEHDGASREHVEWSLRSSLTEMCSRREGRFGEVGLAIDGAACDGRPICAVALAMYEPESWER